MSEQSEREWKSYLLSKGVFGNALRFAHLEKPEEVNRTSMGAAGLDPSDQIVRNRIRFFLMIAKQFLKRDAPKPQRELLTEMRSDSVDPREAAYYAEGCCSCGHRHRRIYCWGGLRERDAVSHAVLHRSSATF